jgi:hypothetical protein
MRHPLLTATALVASLLLLHATPAHAATNRYETYGRQLLDQLNDRFYAGDGYYFLQNRLTGYVLQVTRLPDVDGAGVDGGTQVRAVPRRKTGDWTRFRDAS